MRPTYLPSALLRYSGNKPESWEDMKSLRAKLKELGLYPDLYGSGREG
jgi:uracil-DNA glycosylase